MKLKVGAAAHMDQCAGSPVTQKKQNYTREDRSGLGTCYILIEVDKKNSTALC